jgi:hypothetical protein
LTTVYVGDYQNQDLTYSNTRLDNIDDDIDETNERIDDLNDKFDVEIAAMATYYENEHYLREFRYRTRRILQDDLDTMLPIAFIGDSWTQDRDKYARWLAQLLQADYGKAGIGWVSFGAHPNYPSIITNKNIIGGTPFKWSNDGGVDIGGWTLNYYTTAESPDLSSVESSTVGDVLSGVIYQEFNAAKLFYVGTSAGVVRYSWDNGVTWATQDVSGTGFMTVDMVNVPVFSEGSFTTFKFEVLSGSVHLLGINATISEANEGVIAHNFAASGSWIDTWNSVDTDAWTQTISEFGIKLFILIFGTNDQANRTVAQFESDYSDLVDRVQSIDDSADVLIVMPCENQRDNASYGYPDMVDMAAAARRVAKEKKCAFIDLQFVFGEDPSSYAIDSSRPWFTIDKIHPSHITGGRVILDALYRVLTKS